MKIFRYILIFVCATALNSAIAQNLMNIHQGNGTLLQIPLESIDSARFYTIPPPTIQKIFQSNGNILGIAVSDIDSITYSIPNISALATLSTQSVTVLSSSSAYSGGTITNDGGSIITQRGVCWSTSPFPTLANNFSIDGTGIGAFGSSMAPLQAATTYYARSYAVNSEGTAYGNQLTFTTANPSTSGSLATITTESVLYTDGFVASCGGNISADGGLAVTARGVCWASGTTPTINNSITIDGSGGGAFSSTLTNLLPNTSYFVRAYATNDAGTAYGITYSFSTNGIPMVLTDEATNITSLTALGGGSIISSGNIISQKGLCWSAEPNPDMNDFSSQNGSGTGAFTSGLTNLSPATQYYIRAYAVDGVGNIYFGNQIVFTTTSVFSLGPGVYFDGYNYSTIVLNNGQEWMAENLRTTIYANGDEVPNVIDANEWSGLTTGAWAYCFNESQLESPYGKLYNWYAASDSRNLCPIGWHVPTDLEWSVLINYLDPNADGGANSSNIAGGKMKSSGYQFWNEPNTGATNESGFSGLPGGSRYYDGEFYFGLAVFGSWWSSSEGGADGAFSRSLRNDEVNVARSGVNKRGGQFVRCLRD
jgi:uncharacterized protein (TIGR02145 family)